MAKYAHGDVLDGGLNAIKNAAVREILITSYVAGDSYATVIGRAIATVTIASTDLIITGGDAAPHVLTAATKTQAASGNATAGQDLHIAFTDGAAKVLWVTDELTNQAVTAPNNVIFPALTYTSGQPT